MFRLEDSCCLFTLQGHSGAITAVYMDQVRGLYVGVGQAKPWPLFLTPGRQSKGPQGH